MSEVTPFPNKQLFGWTDPETPQGSYVGYIAVHSHPCETIMVAVRAHESEVGSPVAIAIPMRAALALAQSINAFANEVNYSAKDEEAQAYAQTGRSELVKAMALAPTRIAGWKYPGLSESEWRMVADAMLRVVESAGWAPCAADALTAADAEIARLREALAELTRQARLIYRRPGSPYAVAVERAEAALGGKP